MTVETYREANRQISKPLRTPPRIGGVYDFAEHGGDVGAIKLPIFLPPMTFITQGWIRKLTALTSGGSATVALHFDSAGDVLAATAFDNEKFAQASSGVTKTLQANNITNAIVNDSETDSLQLTLTVAVADLTAGKLALLFEILPIPSETIG